jgi:hypothetical protein
MRLTDLQAQSIFNFCVHKVIFISQYTALCVNSSLHSGSAFYHSTQNILYYYLLPYIVQVRKNITDIFCCFLWVWKMVSHLIGRTQTEGAWGHVAEGGWTSVVYKTVELDRSCMDDLCKSLQGHLTPLLWQYWKWYGLSQVLNNWNRPATASDLHQNRPIWFFNFTVKSKFLYMNETNPYPLPMQMLRSKWTM